YNGRYFSLRDMQVKIGQYRLISGTGVGIGQVFYFDAFIIRKPLYKMFFGRFFVLHAVYFVQTFKAEAGILEALDKAHQLFYRAVELAQDILHGQHGAQGHLSVYYGSSSQKGNKDILSFIDEEGAGLLVLLQ